MFPTSSVSKKCCGHAVGSAPLLSELSWGHDVPVTLYCPPAPSVPPLPDPSNWTEAPLPHRTWGTAIYISALLTFRLLRIPHMKLLQQEGIWMKCVGFFVRQRTLYSIYPCCFPPTSSTLKQKRQKQKQLDMNNNLWQSGQCDLIAKLSLWDAAQDTTRFKFWLRHSYLWELEPIP